MTTERKVSRRGFLRVTVAAVVAGVVAGVGGYYTGLLSAPPSGPTTLTRTVTGSPTTITTASTSTVTTTITPPVTKPAPTPTNLSKSALKPIPKLYGKSPVSVVKGHDVNNMVKDALQIIGGMGEIVKPGDKVLIKPNFTWVGGAKIHKGGRCPPQTDIEEAANTTDPTVIDALVNLVKEAGGEVVIGEGSGGCETLDAFFIRGVDEIARKHQVKTVDLNYDECVSVEVPDPLILKEIWVPKTVREADVIISVPALKAWHPSGITVSLKNMIGTAPGKYYGWAKMTLPHGELPEPAIDKTIVDLAFMNRINLAVVDGLWGNEGTYTEGLKPVKMDLIIAGFDPVAVDSVAAMVMGFDSKKVRHLNLAKGKQLGTNLLDEIIVEGESIDNVRRYFEPPSGLEHIVYKEP